MIKAVLYIMILFFVMWAMDGFNLNSLFKQSRVYQARIMYILISISISYLVINFIYDFVMCFK